MSFLYGILNGLREIRAHKVRSFLSMLGILLGVASLVTLMGVVEGIIKDFRTFFEAQGGIEKVMIHEEEPPEEQRAIASLSPGRTLRDVEAIRSTVPLASHVAGVVELGWKRVRYGRNRVSTPVQGVTPDTLVINKQDVGEGRWLSDLDLVEARNVAVIGHEIARRLFQPGEPILGENIRFMRNEFKIVGVLEEMSLMRNGRNMLRWWNRRIYIPATTAQKRFTGNEELNSIVLRAVDPNYLPELTEQVANALRITHRGIQDIRIETAEDKLEELNKQEAGFTIALGTLAVISLIVGGIGIMNVMLAAINERIREIGVRKAVGARSADIFLQFLAEAIVISVLGGLAGIAVSAGLIELVLTLLPEDAMQIILSEKPILIGFTFSVFTGILAGIYPAVRAARLDPIEALRYE